MISNRSWGGFFAMVALSSATATAWGRLREWLRMVVPPEVGVAVGSGVAGAGAGSDLSQEGTSRGSSSGSGLGASRGLYGGSAMVVSGSTDRKSTRLNSSHVKRSYAVFCLKKKNRD